MKLVPAVSGADAIPLPFDITPHRPLYPFASHWLKGPGFFYHYLDEGRGEPVVAVHGNPTWSFYYRKAVQALCSDHRVIVPDHVGCGLSSRPSEKIFAYTLAGHVDNLEALLDCLGLERNVTLMIHDWGGMIGMACACRRPERIARIVVLNTWAFLIPPEIKLPWQLSFIRSFPVLPELLVRGGNAFSYLATFLAVEKQMAPAVRAGLTAPYNNWENRIATLRFVQDIPLHPDDRSYPLAKWTDEHLHLLRGIPMTICWGMKDFVFDEIALSEWRRRFPEAEVHTFPNGGHYILEDEGEAVIEVVRSFLAGHPLPE
ncbi:MAG TPA: alpha/beta fold hydrolase [Syntrophales bacterium]|nr:alpha/beta fold hydrolase [Syntrophales bacterium]HOU77230.1 alpha/beta fold hydrolase [Syntrophales bacterium]HPC32885.1 alpha/beta fold hydrolase [Syntrophales bacterium]HQG33383.1 alpha/beta fold hydrolase [Syntrophales bacterium]HRU88669.1 alpha/beta fold hydrolase [Syntrophales bacterium]